MWKWFLPIERCIENYAGSRWPSSSPRKSCGPTKMWCWGPLKVPWQSYGELVATCELALRPAWSIPICSFQLKAGAVNCSATVPSFTEISRSNSFNPWRQDVDFVRRALVVNVEVFNFLDDHMKMDRNLAMVALRVHGSAVQYLQKPMSEDGTFATHFHQLACVVENNKEGGHKSFDMV